MKKPVFVTLRVFKAQDPKTQTAIERHRFLERQLLRNAPLVRNNLGCNPAMPKFNEESRAWKRHHNWLIALNRELGREMLKIEDQIERRILKLL